jgi:hypothetical protein
MEKHPYNCARNCYRDDLCKNCDHFVSVDEKNLEIQKAQELFENWQLKRKTA